MGPRRRSLRCCSPFPSSRWRSTAAGSCGVERRRTIVAVSPASAPANRPASGARACRWPSGSASRSPSFACSASGRRLRSRPPSTPSARSWRWPMAEQLVIAVAPVELASAAEALVEAGGRHAMLVAFETPAPSDRLSRARRRSKPASTLSVEEVVLQPNGEISRLRAELPTDAATYTSITCPIPAAQWDEREAHDVYGVVPAGHPALRPLLDPAANT